MLPVLPIGPVVVPVPAFVLLAGIWLGLALAEREARRLGLDAEAVSNLVFYSLVAGLIGARLGHALSHRDAYLADPWALAALTPATLRAEAGLISGAVTALIIARLRGLRLRPTLDALAPGLAVFLVALGLAHLASGDAFGAPARLPWSLYLWDEYRHPTQLYETLAALAILFIVRRRLFGPGGDGLNFLLLAALSAAARLVIEAFRGDSVLLAGGVRAAQVVSLGVLIAALYGLRVWARPEAAREPVEAQGTGA